MNIGKLDRLVTIKQGTFEADAYGEKIRTTSDLASVWARFEFMKGRAGYEADTFIGESPAKVTIRYRSDIRISPKHFIYYNSKEWWIRSIQEIGRKEGLLLMVEEKSTDVE